MKVDYQAKLLEYEKQGFTKFENFLTHEEVEEMRKEISKIVENMNPPAYYSLFPIGRDRNSDEYFINSGDNISYFFENEAVDNGKLLMDKSKAINKIGHGLHWYNPVFRAITYSEKMKDLLRHFEYKDPAPIQGMFIFKNPKIGSEVYPHQDSTYLYTEPLSTIGIWIPLEDVTLENGCLCFVPGSHKGPIYERFVRNPGKDPILITRGEKPKFEESKYVPVCANKGDCVVLHGSVFHKSSKNMSTKPRPIYTFHVIEKKDTVWSEENWLQPTEKLPFISLYSVEV